MDAGFKSKTTWQYSGAGCSQRSQTLDATQMKNKQESEWMFMMLHWRLDDMKLRGHKSSFHQHRWKYCDWYLLTDSSSVPKQCAAY